MFMGNGLVDPVAAQVLAHAAATPDRRAVVCDRQPRTYGLLTERALRVAARLRSLGYEPGEHRRVGIISANDLDMMVVITGCHFAGLTVVPIPYLIMPDAQARMLDDAEVTIVFHDESHADAARAAVAQSRDPAGTTLVPIGRSLLQSWPRHYSISTGRPRPAPCPFSRPTPRPRTSWGQSALCCRRRR
jgi:acyl-CoA synthetase (AMP-forming)/AMP-acid ligase II